MHPNSLHMMKTMLNKHMGLVKAERPRIGDVGAADINGTYRDLAAPLGDYVGIDLAPGPNVDLVGALYEVPGGPYDVILCGQVLEHVEDMRRMVQEIANALVSGGVCFLIAPHTWAEHKHPIDCWRIFPDGMSWLLREAGLGIVEVTSADTDTFGVGLRP